MKLKLDANGNVVLQDGKPVYVHDDGKEVAFDAPSTVQTISRLNAEAKSHRERAEAAETKLKPLEGITDPVAAMKALETVKNLDDKKLVDAGEVEKVKLEAIKAVRAEFDPIVKERDTLKGELYGEKIGGSFARSKVIADKFAIPALTPALLNVALIGAAVLLSPYMGRPEVALAIGVLIAGVAQLVFQLPALARLRLLPIPALNPQHEGVRRVMTLMIPALFGVSVSQINLLLDTFIASLLVSGSVSWLYFSDRLVELPLGIFGIAIATVVLPSLSRKHADKSLADFAAMLDWAFRMVLLIAIPASLALILLAQPLIITLFQGQNFSVDDVTKVTSSLQAYTLGLVAFMSIKVFAPGYYSRQDTRTPVRIGILAMAANMVMNILLVFVLDFAHTGLALATSLAAILNATLLLLGLIRQKVFQFQPGWPVFLLRMAVANVLMCVFLWLVAGDWRAWLDWPLWTRIGWMSVLTVGGLLIYAASLYVSGVRLRHFQGQS